MPDVDLGATPLRELNASLHRLQPRHQRAALDRSTTPPASTPSPPGSNAPITVEINGPVGYYCAGMNKLATVLVHGNAGVGVAENMMSGFVHVTGDASQSAGATGRGGAAPHRRQRLVALRHLDEGHRHRREGLGRAYERVHGAGRQSRRVRRCRRCARRFDLRGAAVRARHGQEPRRRLHREADAGRAQARACTRCSDRAGFNGEIDPAEFKRYGSARKLYNFHVDNAGAY